MATDFVGSREKPLNREPKPQELVQSFLTSVDSTDAYDRNHGAVPTFPASAWKSHTVTIDGEVKQTLKLSPKDLSEQFPQHKVTCALQCAGNRRHAMRTRLKEVDGIDWFDGAILNAEWEGPLLKDVLKAAGVKEQKGLHVAFACYQVKVQEDEWYGGSIPLDRALKEDNEVVLALKMNGEVLNAKHGFPVRAVVPGIIGARSVKWLDSITVGNESTNFYQQHDYKILPPEVTNSQIAEKYWSKVPAMMNNVINSVVAIPEDNETVTLSPSSNEISIKGYAIPQGDDGPIIRVEVSTDDGESWHDAKLGPATRYSWVIWEARVPIQRGDGKRIFSRATDRGGNRQESERGQWNLRGVGYNGYESTVGLKVV